METRGRLVVSLDLELFWGRRRHAWIDESRDEVLATRRAVSKMLDLLSDYGVRATWPVVGMLFCRTKSELLDHLPRRLPGYDNPALSPYPHIARIGASESEDPLHYAATLVDEISRRPGQEVASHTFSNFYCRAPGATGEEFAADLRAAIDIARRRQIILRTLAVPDNEMTPEVRETCRRHGISTVRRAPTMWPHRSESESSRLDGLRNRVRRWARTLDAVVPLTGTRCVEEGPGEGASPVEVAVTRRWRPLSGHPSLLAMQRRRIAAEVDEAARSGKVIHLWAKSRDFNRPWARLAGEFRRTLDRFDDWRRRDRMTSMTIHGVGTGSGGPVDGARTSRRAL